MQIKLNKPFARNGGVDEFDVKQVKKALNRLGYYQPHVESGITGIPDAGVFSALKAFQKDSGLRASGAAKPDDETVAALNTAVSKAPPGKYIWRTVGDNRVREEHAALDGEVREWNDSPDPGKEFNCRCWAEPIKIQDAIIPVYPELFLIPASKFGRIAKIVAEYFRNNGRKGYTDHGNLRSNQRGISPEEVQGAIRSAKITGNVTTKIGKYGTPQNHYKGSNGVTVIEETSGRNAGKIITMWRHK